MISTLVDVSLRAHQMSVHQIPFDAGLCRALTAVLTKWNCCNIQREKCRNTMFVNYNLFCCSIVWHSVIIIIIITGSTALCGPWPSISDKKTPWSESASELYRPSDRHLSAKWLPTFADRRCHVVSVTDPYGRILGFLDRGRYFSIK
jgi:hypothetical protein